MHLEAAARVVAVGKQPRQNTAVFADDGADLVGRHHVAVQLPGLVAEVFVELLPAFAPAEFFAGFDALFAFRDHAATGRYFGFDGVDIEGHVDAVGHRFLVGVFAHHVAAEEAVGAAVGRGGKAHQEGVVVFQYLPPEVVDAAVGFVDDDEVELPNGVGRVVFHRQEGPAEVEQRGSSWLIGPVGGRVIVLLPW